MREICLDTETTGLNPKEGHKIIEIGCIELINHLPTGKYFHTYINPNRNLTAESVAITGLNQEFLQQHELFKDITAPFLQFIQNDPLVIHNAAFDMGFLNAELEFLDIPSLSNKVIDTLKIARQKFPGSPASLDALAKRFKVDTSKRQKHGALIDAEILSQIYLELIGGRQHTLIIPSTVTEKENNCLLVANDSFPRRYFPLTELESQQHREFVKQLKNTLWDFDE